MTQSYQNESTWRLTAFAVLSEPAVGAEALEVVVLIQGARTAVDARRRRALAERCKHKTAETMTWTQGQNELSLNTE